jgi:hypothetical protein
LDAAIVAKSSPALRASTVVACADSPAARILQIVRPRSFVLLVRFLAVAVCALAGHVMLYQAVLPSDEAHGYLSWYEPAIAGLSLAAVAGLAGLVLYGLVRRDFRLPLRNGPSFDRSATRLAVAGVAFLLVQETIEHSVADHSLSVVSVADGRWLAALVVVAVAAAALAFLARLGERAVRALFADRQPRAERVVPEVASAGAPGQRRRSRPLAHHGALRAPPTPSPA